MGKPPTSLQENRVASLEGHRSAPIEAARSVLSGHRPPIWSEHVCFELMKLSTASTEARYAFCPQRVLDSSPKREVAWYGLSHKANSVHSEDLLEVEYRPGIATREDVLRHRACVLETGCQQALEILARFADYGCLRLSGSRSRIAGQSTESLSIRNERLIARFCVAIHEELGDIVREWEALHPHESPREWEVFEWACSGCSGSGLTAGALCKACDGLGWRDLDDEQREQRLCGVPPNENAVGSPRFTRDNKG